MSCTGSDVYPCKWCGSDGVVAASRQSSRILMPLVGMCNLSKLHVLYK